MTTPKGLPLNYVMINPPLEVRALRNRGDIKAGGTYYVAYVSPLGLHLLTLPAGNGIGNPVPFDMLTEVEHEAANDNGGQ